ncbi:PEP-CTERM system histidine kinase PrsK [Thalassotalea sp. 1_MG-2023]|uniref:XrtA/PEP-CTERM system histidine kinase PrsK n=1 Tax=Thalassotalea sp. 1_MG-2023 TaxID=3062680 RepID=UPI0026E29E8C|nr:XrtA/PEP-CTERM system histidine kinase PrsK [Thalassotalea sp. 1_MG-2023]MDO6425463.1 PEP-CTERM system histidine kinase PrsK [Thalassotalea sp. 1_MG-2023]
MEFIGFVGFVLSFIAYVIFTFLLVAARNTQLLARWTIVSVLTTTVASALAALQIKLGFGLQWVLVADGLKVASWAILVLICNTELTSIRQLLSNYHIRQYVSVWSALMLVCWLASYLLNYSYEYIYLLFIVLNLWSLVLMEQLYRSADDQIRWAIWPLIIALASIAIFDFVMYAQATMVGSIDFDFWFSRGYIAVAVLPLLLVSTRRIKNGSVRIFVSRQVVFYSSILMMAGLYLLIMALAGYVINYVGGEWGSVVSIGFLMLSGVVLVALLITESLRRKLKVFIAKNFFANRYEYRDEWLNLIEKIETTNAENYYQMATSIMMSKLNAGSGAIVKRKSDLHFDIKYSHGLKLTEAFDLQLTFISQFCQKKGWIIDVEEYEITPTMYPELNLDLDLCQSFDVRFIIPIFIGKAFYGLFLIGNINEANQLNWEDRDLLFAVSKQLGNFISLNEANDELAESKQFDAFNRMSAFLVHDLKNVQAQLALITTNAEKHRNNPEFVDDVFETVESATDRLGKVLSQLRNKRVEKSTNSEIDLVELLEKVVEQRNVEKPLVIVTQAVAAKLATNEEKLHSVLNHLIQNAQEASTEDSTVELSLKNNKNIVTITITDQGTGMSEDFIKHRLFKPFDTTKGNAGMGIGVYEAKQFIESVDGTIEVISTEHSGTTFTIQLPINATDNE